MSVLGRRGSAVFNALWVACLLFYVVALIVTGWAGPFWALWVWSLVALPLFISWAKTRWDSSVVRIPFWTWLFLVVIIPAVAFLKEGFYDGFPDVVRLAALVLLVSWPLVLTTIVLAGNRNRTNVTAG